MSLLDSSELGEMRTLIAETLPDTAIVSRLSRASDGMGGFTETWAAAGTAAVRVSPYNFQFPTEGRIAERLASREPWLLTFGALADVGAADRVAVGSRTFEVLGIFGPRSFELERQVVAVEGV